MTGLFATPENDKTTEEIEIERQQTNHYILKDIDDFEQVGKGSSDSSEKMIERNPEFVRFDRATTVMSCRQSEVVRALDLEDEVGQNQRQADDKEFTLSALAPTPF